MEKTLKLSLKSNRQNMAAIRAEGIRFFKSHGLSDDTARVPIMILKELVKSGKKYGGLTPAGSDMTIQLHIGKKTITVEVMNPVDPNCIDRLKELDKNIQFIRGYQDPFEPYSKMRNQASNNSINSESADLGLAKIVYEGGAILDFFISEDNVLNLSAVKNLDKKL
jgi:hypothetical protein